MGTNYLQRNLYDKAEEMKRRADNSYLNERDKRWIYARAFELEKKEYIRRNKMADSKKITREQLGKVAERMLKFLDEKGINSFKDLEEIMNKEFLIDKETKEHIHIEFRPSGGGTRTYTMSYIVPNKGIPLEFKISEDKQYSRIIAKGDFELPEYVPFAVDPFGNTVQIKSLDSFLHIPLVRKELKKLKDKEK